MTTAQTTQLLLSHFSKKSEKDEARYPAMARDFFPARVVADSISSRLFVKPSMLFYDFFSRVDEEGVLGLEGNKERGRIADRCKRPYERRQLSVDIERRHWKATSV